MRSSLHYLEHFGRSPVEPDVKYRIQTFAHYPDMSEVRVTLDPRKHRTELQGQALLGFHQHFHHGDIELRLLHHGIGEDPQAAGLRM
jgi:hypothetical protein